MELSFTTKGFNIAEPGVEDTECAFCDSGILHSIMEMQNGAGQWIAIPICVHCQTNIMISLARDLAMNEGYADTPDEVAEYVSCLNWVNRDPVEGEDFPAKDGDSECK